MTHRSYRFEDIRRNPEFFTVLSGGVREPSSVAVRVVAAEAYITAVHEGITDLGGIKAIEQEYWREFYQLLPKEENNESHIGVIVTNTADANGAEACLIP